MSQFVQGKTSDNKLDMNLFLRVIWLPFLKPHTSSGHEAEQPIHTFQSPKPVPPEIGRWGSRNGHLVFLYSYWWLSIYLGRKV